ncbi:MAG TPA: hypothetical protein VNC50_12585 [Planctomycetia bacterium]|nr:hypothetical protein [Planctomycetia bacterium]
MQRSFMFGLALALVAASGFAGPAAAPGEQTPFKGSLEGFVTRTPVPPLVAVDIDAAGNATHLGAFSLEVPHLVDPATRTATGTYTFTAADGSEVHAEFTGVSALTAIPGVLYIVENATITGGTGRFEGASGGFVCERFFDTVSGETYGYFNGAISTP